MRKAKAEGSEPAAAVSLIERIGFAVLTPFGGVIVGALRLFFWWNDHHIRRESEHAARAWR